MLYYVLGVLPFLAFDLWFFLAQRGSRSGQFPQFHLLASLDRLARYSAATLLGGLPLYVPGALRATVSAALGALLVGLIGLVIWRWGRIGHPSCRLILAAAALAPPAGLLALGLVFNNTPIELRYLSFATPFIGLLLAGAFTPLPRIIPALLLGVQAAALFGLLVRPETMQPAQSTARAAAALVGDGVGDGVILLPYGNDGVGIVGAFASEIPTHPLLQDISLIVIRPDEPVSRIRQTIAGYRRVVLAGLAQDDASRAAMPVMRAALASPCWRIVAEGSNVAAYERVCPEE
jgi:hypothetical protein